MTEITIFLLCMKDILDILNLAIEGNTHVDRGQRAGRHRWFPFQTSPDGLAGAFEAAHGLMPASGALAAFLGTGILKSCVHGLSRENGEKKMI
jgi:hypothetical protein